MHMSVSDTLHKSACSSVSAMLETQRKDTKTVFADLDRAHKFAAKCLLDFNEVCTCVCACL
jgi:hypothetical protein